MAAGLAGFAVYDLQAGVPIAAMAWLILADILEILVAAWGVNYALGGVPRLNSLKALAKFSFFTVFLASVIVSTIGVYGLDGNWWISWRISFLSEGLAFLTVAPAILGGVGEGSRWLRASRTQVLEVCVIDHGVDFPELCNVRGAWGKLPSGATLFAIAASTVVGTAIRNDGSGDRGDDRGVALYLGGTAWTRPLHRTGPHRPGVITTAVFMVRSNTVHDSGRTGGGAQASRKGIARRRRTATVGCRGGKDVCV
jgi:hypothetical protein